MKWLFFIIFCTPLLSSAQNQCNIWYFGEGVGLDFNSVSPDLLYDGETSLIGCDDPDPFQCHAEGTTAISDSSGSLLFYSDGHRVWNRNHEILPNGDDLMGNVSSTQSSLIIPKPGSNRFFYLFTTDSFFENELQNGFRYSIIDACADDGYGDINPLEKKYSIARYSCRKTNCCQPQ